MISLFGKDRTRALCFISFVALLALFALQAGCSQSQCTSCNFDASNLSLSTSGTFLFSPVTAESVKKGSSLAIPLTINTDANYAGEVIFSVMYPELRAIDTASTVKFTVTPANLHLTAGESTQVVVNVTSSAATPVLTSQFYVTATDITVANNPNPYFVMVTVPLAISGP